MIAAEPLDAVRESYRSGDLFGAYRYLQKMLPERGDPERYKDPVAGYYEALLLSNLGNHRDALNVFDKYGFGKWSTIDQRVLEARLWKEIGYENVGIQRQEAFARSTELYHTIGIESGDSFPLINAATMMALSGRAEESRALALEVLSGLDGTSGSYWDEATRAEANLIIGEHDEAARILVVACQERDVDNAARASTIRQFLRIARAQGWDEQKVEGIIGSLRPNPVLHFAGHTFLPDKESERRLVQQIEASLGRHGCSAAYGALAAGADILFAEAVLRRGTEYQCVIPFDAEDFLAVSVAPFGEEWLPRFESARSAATSVKQTSDMGWVGDDNQFTSGALHAMGLARLRARLLFTKAVQIVVWDGHDHGGAAGTSADVANWKKAGGITEVIDGANLPRLSTKSELNVEPARYERGMQALLFTDFPGFSRLSEPQLAVFQQQVMERCAEILDRKNEVIRSKNSWGDALFVVFDQAEEAAELCLAMQDALREIDFDALGVDQLTSMRFALHYGPVFCTNDALTGGKNFFGTEVNLAARLEPSTPPGVIYVTEPFAASLCLSSASRLAVNYVGEIDLAKNYGRFPIYRLSVDREAQAERAGGNP